MKGVFLTILNMSISASFIILAVLAVRLFLRKAPKWISVLLWSIAALRLVLPFSLQSSVSLIPSSVGNGELVERWQSEYTENISVIRDDSIYYEAALEAGRVPAVDDNGEYYVITKYDRLGEPSTVGDTVVPILSAVWITGMAVMVLYALFSYFRLKHRIGTAIPEGDGVYKSENVSSPFVLGIIKPKIYLPFDMSEENAKYVISHEKAHIARLDQLWKPIGFVLLAVHWFNPVMWLSYMLLCRDIELACDEKVIADLAANERADYSEALLCCSTRGRLISACPIAFGEVGVKRRVKQVMNYKKPTFWIIVIAVILCIVVAVCFLTNPVQNKDSGVNKDKSVENNEIAVNGDDEIVIDDIVIDDTVVDDIVDNAGAATNDNAVDNTVDNSNETNVDVDIDNAKDDEYRLEIPTETPNIEEVAEELKDDEKTEDDKTAGGDYSKMYTKPDKNGVLFEYYFDGDRLYISGFKSANPIETLTIPSEIDGVRVYALNNFKEEENYGDIQFIRFDLQGIKHLIIEEGAQRIFELTGSENLETVKLPKSVNLLASFCFMDAKNLKSINLENVVTVSSFAFQNCTALKTVNLENATKVGTNAFENVLDLTIYGKSGSEAHEYAVKYNVDFVSTNGEAEVFGEESDISEWRLYTCGYITKIDRDSVTISVAEYIERDEEDRIQELGLDESDFPNGYYIHYIGNKTYVLRLSEDIVYNFIDWNRQFTTDGEDLHYSTTSFDEFLEYLDSYTDGKPGMPFFFDEEHGEVISINEKMMM